MRDGLGASQGAKAGGKPPGRVRRRALAAGLGVLAALAAGEAAVRVHRARTRHVPANALDPYDLHATRLPAVHDPRLGFVPRAGLREERVYGHAVSTDELGLRGAGRQDGVAGVATSATVALLALGDSFTFGADVDDGETWPAALERRLGRAVANGGVFGYGLDQVVLRAEQLVPRLRPALVVVALVPDDVTRCAYAYRFAWKPYFRVEAGELVLRGVPVPAPDVPPALPSVSTAQRLLGTSQLADAVLSRLAPGWWRAAEVAPVQPFGEAAEVAALLVVRLDALARAHGARLVLVTLDHPPWDPGPPLEPVAARARAVGVEVLDLAAALRERATVDPAGTARLFTPTCHLSVEGNAWVAERIAERLAAALPR